MKDTYKTIGTPTKGILFKEKGSKFYGYAFPVITEDQIKAHLEAIKKEHHSARHWCYAWQLGTEPIRYRANDDGEPSNSAGMPIYGQLQAFDITNTLIIVVRYFGGVKLGVGGLIQAYKNTAKLTLETATIVEKVLTSEFILSFAYPTMNTAMRIIKEQQLTIIHQQLELDCKITIAVRQKNAATIQKLFENTYGISITVKDIN